MVLSDPIHVVLLNLASVAGVNGEGGGGWGKREGEKGRNACYLTGKENGRRKREGRREHEKREREKGRNACYKYRAIRIISTDFLEISYVD